MKTVKMVVLIGMIALGAVYAGNKAEEITTEQNNKLLVEVAIGALNAGDWEALGELYSATFRQHDPGVSEPLTWTDFELGCRLFHHKVPSFKYEIEDIIAEGNKVAVRLRWSARDKRWFKTYDNPMGNISGTEMNLVRIEDGRIVEEWVEYNPKQIKRLISWMKYMGKQ